MNLGTKRRATKWRAWCTAILVIGLAGLGSRAAHGQTYQEDFTGTTTNNSWFFFNGACLTAGTVTSTSSPGYVPGCTTVWSTYYDVANSTTGKAADPYMVGGDLGYLGSSAQSGQPTADIASTTANANNPNAGGALRFTNGYPYGYHENGAIVSNFTFPSNQGLEITFKTVTYLGDSGGTGQDGADGISFYLLDGCMPLQGATLPSNCSGGTYGSNTYPGIGAWGGSLAYTCSNANPPYDGLVGAYLGLGIDEFGNFLNGTSNTLGETGTTATGDNTASGGGYQPGRIGLRGAGDVAFTWLSQNFSADYPSSLTSSCLISGGTYSSTAGMCVDICPAGSTYDSTTNVCNKACTNGSVYDSVLDTCNSCPSGTYSNTSPNSDAAPLCINTTSCPTGTTYNSATQSCASCPASGYATGTYSSGSCINSCPTGDSYVSGYCSPTGDSSSSHYYCPGGETIASYSGGYVCYPSSGVTYASGYYCPSGDSVTGTSCYPTGYAHSSTYYCPSGDSIASNSGSYVCYPSSGVNYASGYYCSTGNSVGIYNSSGYCYPSSGYTFSSGYYCPTGYTYQATGNCKKNTNGTIIAATAASGATAASAANSDTAATAASAATPMAAAQSVAPVQSATQNLTPTETAPQTVAASTGYPDSVYSVQNTCKTGYLWNYSSPTSASETTTAVADYQALPGAYTVPGINIANESATTRSQATPIFYDVKITPTGYLTFSYAINGGSFQAIIKNLDIQASNGTLPAALRFGFAGSTGGDTNVHEVLCFKVAPSSESGGSTAVNEKQSSKLQPNATQAYFGYYNPTPTFWTGDLTANYLIDTNGTVTVSSTANWSASCVLTGVASGQTCPRTGAGPSNAEAPASRVVLTWDNVNNKGIPLEWGNLNANQQASLNVGDSPTGQGQARLNYLRGDRSNEVGVTGGLNLFRYREGVLADIVDSSPEWVGPPSSPYTATWTDRLYPLTAQAENSGNQTYLQYVTAQESRTNVVYVGANDGLVHGFRAGSYDSSGNYVSTNNDGEEVLAYMPGAILQSLGNTCASSTSNPTESVAQNIHGVIPSNSACGSPAPAASVSTSVDYSNAQYGHNFFVDATPGTGDLFYADSSSPNGEWHTWLVGGLGAGGAAIYALDITNPANFSEANAKALVIGEWTAATATCIAATNCPSSTISCSGNTSCGLALGDTYGTPQIRRLHNGDWGVIFGNGIGSSNGDAGIFVMTIDPKTAAETFYYLSTGVGSASNANGIAYVAPADLDGDHVTDYVYAGDLQGNLWRFDLTSSDPTKWAVSSGPLFAAGSGQPITSQVVVAAVPVAGASPRVMVAFGTGQRTQFTNTTQAVYASGQQALYGVWDWNMTNWNTLNPAQAYAALTAAQTGLSSSPYTLASSNLAQQTFTCTSGSTITCDGTNVTICWQGSTACSSGNTQFGWYANLVATATNYGSEQIIYNPAFYNGTFVVDSTLPATNNAFSCTTNLDRGLTYVISLATGGVLSSVFPKYTDANLTGVETDATGTPSVVTTTEGTTSLVYQTVGGTPGTTQISPPANMKATRLTWIQLR